MSKFEIIFNPSNGSVRIDGLDFTIQKGMKQSEFPAELLKLEGRRRNLNNGYEWVSFGGLYLESYPCFLSACFYLEKLHSISWALKLESESGASWPTEEEIITEISILRPILSRQFGQPIGEKDAWFNWGRVWCVFDRKGFLCASGLQYNA
jgi:hypothetical protein